MNVLVIDNDPEVRVCLQLALSFEDITCVTASSGAEGLQKIYIQDFDPLMRLDFVGAYKNNPGAKEMESLAR